MSVEVAMDLVQPRLLQHIVDVGIANRDLAMVIHTGGIMVLAGVIGLLAGGGCGVLATIAGLSFGANLRGNLFRRVQSLSFGNLDRLETGHLITRLTNDVDQVQDAAQMLMRILVRAPLLAIGGLVMAIITAPRLTWIMVCIAPAIIVLLVYVSRRGHDLFLALQARLDRFNTVLQESLAGVRVIKAFLRADHEVRRFAGTNDDLMASNVRASSLMAGVGPLMGLLLNLGAIAVLWFGGWQVARGEAHIGQLLAFTNYLMQMLFSLMMVGMLVIALARADASAQRIAQVLTAEPEVTDSPDAAPVTAPRGRVEFDSVTFGYDGEEAEPVLRGVSFVAEPGETVAILGATGSGKSSLVHLVPRLYDVKAGRVLLDGADVRSLSQEDLRHHIGMVLQDTTLFSGSIRDNIRYGRPDAGDDEVVRAAQLAQADPFISDLPEGYDTPLGQKGVNLSGGQKQRLAIARALLCRPSVLILDDCTSAVDADTEAQIMQALDQGADRCTRLVVAQRIGSVLSADRILVLEDGVIAAQGTHSELLETSPLYRDIVASQLDTQEPTHV
jgi:ATP-binding cassette subfamily B protein